MPIPTKWWDKKEIEKEHWHKVVEWETISETLRNGETVYEYRKLQFDAKYHYCQNCRTDEYVYLISMPRGVYKVCMKCAGTLGLSAQGPLPTIEGTGQNKRKLAKVIDSKILENKFDYAECAHRLNWKNERGRWHP